MQNEFCSFDAKGSPRGNRYRARIMFPRTPAFAEAGCGQEPIGKRDRHDYHRQVKAWPERALVPSQ
jgi:hypothetical protein